MRPERLLATPAAPVEDMGILQDLARSPKVARLHALWENMAISKAKQARKMPAQIPANQGNMPLALVKLLTTSAGYAPTGLIAATVYKFHAHQENMENNCPT